MAMDVIVLLLVCLFGSFAEANTSLSWFDFYDGKALSGHNDERIAGINAEECARWCLVGTSAVPSGSCLSFEYDNQVLRCILSRSTKDTPGAVLADSSPPSRYDYYHRRNAPAPYSPCDFEADLCQYTQDTTDDFDWTRDSGGTPTGITGPSVDHTTGTSSGYYMYIEASNPRQQGDIARLISPYYRAYPDGQCLLFWTHMYGGQIGTLTVSVKARGTTTAIWTRSGDQGNQWFSVAVSIPTTGSYQVFFEGVRGGNANGDIAIDDVSILQGACPAPYGPCDFETDLCQYTQDTTDDFDWTRHSGGTTSSITGPSVDHTTGTRSGYYMYIETSSPRRDGDVARLISPSYRPYPDGQCLTFWTHMYGSQIGTLTVSVKARGTTTAIWTRSGDQGNQWFSVAVSIPTTGSYQVIFEGVRGGNAHGDIAIDDVSILQGACPVSQSCSPLCFTFFPDGPCDFETDLCQYTQDTTDSFDWTRHSGGTPTAYTGPTVDHTTGTRSGHYIYIETSSPRQDGDVARLISPSYRPYPDGQCLLFWAHMYGDLRGYVGTLTVSVKAGCTTTDIWSRSRNQGNQWFSVAVSIQTTGSYQVIFEGVRGIGAHGDIAIDDVSILQGACPDVDECVPRQGKGPCDHTCTNTVGSYICTCNSAYRLNSDGHTCDRVQCPIPTAPENGAVTGNNSYQDVVQFTCNHGYQLIGGSSRSCQADGTWTGTDPTCIDIDECATVSCGSNRKCRNTPGGYECPCKSGYKEWSGKCRGNLTYNIITRLLNPREFERLVKGVRRKVAVERITMASGCCSEKQNGWKRRGNVVSKDGLVVVALTGEREATRGSQGRERTCKGSAGLLGLTELIMTSSHDKLKSLASTGESHMS